MDTQEEEEAFCLSMPKAELHAHLSGSLTTSTLLELIHLHKENFPDEELPKEVSNFAKMINDNDGFDQTYEIFRIAQSVVDHPEAVRLATRRVIEEFFADNVKYLELRSTPREVHGKMSKEDYILAVVSTIEECTKSLPIITKFLVSIDRRNTIEDAEAAGEFCKKMNKAYPAVVIGIDLSGDARVNDALTFLPLLKNLSHQGLYVTVHLAEVPNHHEVSSFLNPDWLPDRIGHGTCLHPRYGGTEELWKKFVLLSPKIPVEICISSNQITDTSEEKSNHHVQEMYEANVDVIICTDDKGVFNCNLSTEYFKAMKLLKLTTSDLFDLSYSSLDHIFTTEIEKDALRDLWNQWKEENVHKLKK